MAVAAAPRRAAARLWWYIREFTGETAYERYAERLCREGRADETPSRKEFERRRAEERYGDPRNGGGCC
jgi:uncharacterized short protein YbdD (DUF466 family)